MTLYKIKALICTIVGMIGAVITNLFGGWTRDMETLLIFMAIDFLTGLIVAGVFKRSEKSSSGALDSHAGWKGLCKKCVTLFFVLIAHRLDLVLDTNYIRTATTIGFILNELISITENAGLMGIPLPQIITKAIEVLKHKRSVCHI